MSRGQAMVELALCAPIVAMLALGSAAIVQIADAGAGLQAATQAAAAVAARAPNSAQAEAAAQTRFAALVAAYPISHAVLKIDPNGFVRSGIIRAYGAGSVAANWAGLLPFPAQVDLRASATTRVEAWRSRGVTS